MRLLAGDGLQQILRTLERQLGIAVLRFELGDIGLVVLYLRLKRRLFELVEKIALFDLGALDKQPLFEESADPGDQRHPADRLNAPDKLVGMRDLLALRAHDPDCRRSGGCGLGVGPDGEHGYDQEQEDNLRERPVFHRVLENASMPSLLGHNLGLPAVAGDVNRHSPDLPGSAERRHRVFWTSVTTPLVWQRPRDFSPRARSKNEPAGADAGADQGGYSRSSSRSVQPCSGRSPTSGSSAPIRLRSATRTPSSAMLTASA